MINQQQQKIIIDTLQPYNPKMIGIFGSFARSKNTAESDLDILVEFHDTVNLLDLIGLEIQLSEKLQIKVDLITSNAISPRIEPSIRQELQRIF